MEFKKYSSIENSYRQKFIDKCQLALPNGIETACQITEKIHGTNFSFYAEGDSVCIDKRTGWCETDFYSCSEVFNKYKGSVSRLLKNYSIQSIIVYGELAGSGIQGKPDYGEKDFYVFDIKANGVFLGTPAVEVMCHLNGLKHVPILSHHITLREALAFEETFRSRILKVEGNNAEGIVIKPLRPYYLPNGERIIFKKKNPTFSERDGKKGKARQIITPLSEDDQDLVDAVALYLCHNRILGVVSKEGTLTPKDFGKIAGLTLQDALEDYQKDHELSLRREAYDYGKVSKTLMKYSCTVLRDHWLDILDTPILKEA